MITTCVPMAKPATGAFTDYGKGVLAERYFLSEFGKDYWYDGFNRYLDGCTDFLQLDAQGEPFDRATDPERLEISACSSGLL